MCDYKASTLIGFNGIAVAKCQAVGTPNGTAAPKLAAYLGVTTDFLLTGQEEPKPIVTDDDIKFALFGGDGEITDAMFEEVKQFAAFVRQREAEKKE